ncbi:protein HbrB [Penicillium brasilianum]|uniref:Protein HbrB n=1 Tax=Penicillium brasilianum TaxID=104259 RepID=A0A1S9RQ41_PENBI|nr:protein HbrB [Penicillium brasilianum]
MNPVRNTNSPGRSTRPPAPVYRHPPPQSRRPPPSDDEDDDDDDSDDDELGRPGSSGSDASSNVTTVSAAPITPINTHPPTAGYFSPQLRSASTTTSPQHAARAMPQDTSGSRRPSGRGPSIELPRHRSRHHSQGFFEPTLPTASSDQLPPVSASRIAAQAAMQQMKRPQNGANTFDDSASRVSRRSGSASPPLMPPPLRINQPSPSLPPPNAATTAANVVFPRAGASPLDTQIPEKQKKKKLFSKPKHIGISRDKDSRDRGLPSPSKLPGLSRIVSASTTSLADLPSNNSSMYNLSNASVSTVVPADRPPAPPEKDKDKDKDKHKHHFLSRQKLKLKDRDDHFNLPLSSASSNSRPADPNAPQSLYSFTSPASPAPGATFGKSVSGLDLLHGGRALREKKKEEKALADSETMDWLANSAGGATTPGGFAGPSSLNSSSGVLGEAVLRETLQGFGLNNMSPEDAWDFLKAKLLVIFDGEDVRIAIEDLNKLVLVHLQRCVHKRAPASVITDLQELLETGFATLNHSSLVGIPDEKLVPHLVQIWLLVFGTILPFIQAVFLPLDLEFKGLGTLMTSREALEFWGALPAGGSLDVRNLVLIAFRDRIILNRYETLKATFSRLSLDSINSGFPTLSVTAKSAGAGGRPGTAASLDAGLGSYNSQSSTLLSTGIADSYSSDSMSALARPLSSDSRSRAASNTSSNPDPLIFSSISPQTSNQRPTIIHRGTSADSSHVITETVGRMLQCVSVLASVQTDDPSQEKIEVLSKALKHNWLGRGRTGRDRRGFVGAKIRPVMVAGTSSLDDTESFTTAGISIGASTSTSGSRARGDSSSSEWSGQGAGAGMSMRSGGRRELSVV